MRKIMILENTQILNGSNYTGSARSFLRLTSFTTMLLLSTASFAQTVIMLEEDLLGSIDPIFREQVRKETLDKNIAPKKVVGSKKFKADVPKANREYKKKRKIIKSADSDAVEAKAAQSTLQAVFSQPLQASVQSQVLGQVQSSTQGPLQGEDQLNGSSSNRRVGQSANLGSREFVVSRSVASGRVRREQPANAVLDDITTGGIPTRKANNQASAVEAGSGRITRGSPYAAEGFKLGSWLAFANLRQSAAYSTNLNSTAKAKGGFISQSDVEFSARSNWARHQAQINASGGFARNFGAGNTEIPTGDISGDLLIDLVDGFTATSRLGYNYTNEAVTSTALSNNISERPGVHAINGSVGLERSGNKLSLILRGSVDRTNYENAKLFGGYTLSQKDRDNTFYQLTARTTYETSTAFSPFVELKLGTRDFDIVKDRNNQERSSSTYGGSVGVGIDLGEKLTGDISVGYSVEDFKDKNLKNLEGFTFDGSLAWSPVRETNITLNSSTQFSGATTAGVSGSILNNLDITATRQINDRTQLSATSGVVVTTDTDYKVDTTLWNVGTSFEYSLNNHLALTGALEYQQQFSDRALNAYNSTTLRSGIRLQR